jgi:hypothetical protein
MQILFLRPNPAEKRQNGLFERRTGRQSKQAQSGDYAGQGLNLSVFQAFRMIIISSTGAKICIFLFYR